MKKLSFFFIILAVLGSSCKKDFLTSLQNNPNAPVVASGTPPLVLPGTLTALVSITNGPYVGAVTTAANPSYGYQSQGAWLGYWNYSGGYSFNQTVQEYVMTNTQPQVWDGYYSILANLNFIIQQSAANPNYYAYGAIANVIEAICYQNLVDAYNDVPYSNALKGPDNLFPAYDKGSDIYDSLVLKLDAAIATLQSTPSSTAIAVGSDDVLFQGDLGQWAKFANTVKLRILLQESAVTAKQAQITSEIGKTDAVGYLTADALVNPGYSSAQQGPMYGNFGISPSGSLNGDFNYIRAGGFALNFYLHNHDPRLAYFYCQMGQDPTNSKISDVGDYYAPAKGVPPASADTGYAADVLGIQNTQPTKGSGIGPGLIKSPTQGAPLFAAAESYFIQAEAVLRGYPVSSGAAQALYQDGIKASFEYLGVGGASANPDDLAQTYYSQTGVTNVSWPAATADQITTVITQKWAALNGINNATAWNDWRRTGFPVVPLSVSPTLAAGSHMPYRYLYPSTELNQNPAAYKAAGGDNVDPYNTKIFWMP